jgi:Fe-S oxidoreductase
LFETLREQNTKLLRKTTSTVIMTADPHTYNTLKNEYNGALEGRTVLHSAEVLESLFAENRLVPEPAAPLRATYHDPCYLGRYNGIYDAPRRVLGRLGVEVVEMPRSREHALCCGAGGGRIWMEDSAGGRKRPADLRVLEAADTLGEGVLVTACPKDTVMFLDAVKTNGLEGRIAVRELAQVVLDRVSHTNGKE